MRDISVGFVDFWKGFNSFDNFIVDRLKQYYNVVVSEKPDYLFYSSFGGKHYAYPDSIKIYFTGENDVPNFNECDYAMAFQHIEFEDRYLRFPLYLLYDDLYDKIQTKNIQPEQVLNRKFCNFVYSNSKYADPFRTKFFKELSTFKKVDSGGRYLNNIGGPVTNKLDFIKNYKFTIAFENSSLSGYTTEKILEPMVVNSLPIYWGNLNVCLDFNSKSFINISDYPSVEAAIEYIIQLDNDDELYLNILNRPWVNRKCSLEEHFSKLDLFFLHIFDQPLEKAKRCSKFGFAKRLLPKNKFLFFISKF